MVFGLKLGLPRKANAEPPPRFDASPGGQGKNSGERDRGDKDRGRDERSGGGGGQTRALTVNEFVARTKKSKERGLEPTKPELVAYARYLGIDSITDGDLMWIAEESLNAPLPAEWTEHNDSQSRVFYYNVETHASSWTHPLEQLHRDTYKTIVKFRSGDLSKDEQVQQLEKFRQDMEDAEAAAHQELQVWTEHIDEQGQKFYYNHQRQRSVWTDPRPARCHQLYLQMKALRVLSKHCGQGGGAGSTSERIDRLKHLKLVGKVSAASHDDRDKSRDKDGGKKKKKKRELSELEDSYDYPLSDREMNDRDRDRGDRNNRRDRDRDSDHEGPPVPIEVRNHLLDLKKPSTAAVNEVRKAIGVADSLSPIRGGGLPGLGVNQLPAFEGDGLSSVGRTRVRAGIKLEPLEPLKAA
eukprot:TRINITY_DN16606_c2_g1_i1.p1 TRINITY_DN16606_c2_g1~~TRINITY_DN16606_c2_g1_i1.p1  ORF type:complete len:411 (-),score=82.76 TRINITY_DN16606_c2_g1_i1:84-1316(-)